MIDLIRIFSMENFFDILEAVVESPSRNASSIAKNLAIHIATVQKVLDTLEKYGFIAVDKKRGPGRPSRIYTYRGGSFTVDIDALLSDYAKKHTIIRETGNPNVSFSYDVDKELVNAVLIGGKAGNKVKLEERAGRLLWLIPPPDSEGMRIDALAKAAAVPVIDAVHFCLDFQKLDLVEKV